MSKPHSAGNAYIVELHRKTPGLFALVQRHSEVIWRQQ
jgi:hypothetical protein